MRKARHGHAIHLRCIASVPGRQDVQTRCKDIDAFAVIRKVCASVADSGRADSDGVCSRGRREGASVAVRKFSVRNIAKSEKGLPVIVTGSNGEVQTTIYGIVDSFI